LETGGHCEAMSIFTNQLSSKIVFKHQEQQISFGECP